MKQVILFTILGLFIAHNLNAQQLSVGDKAPVFKALDENKKIWDANHHFGKEYVVVFFYPAAMTGGCTKQACTYRDFKDDFTKLGATVIGISGDEPENLVYFKRANNLNFPLLSDTNGEVSKAYGVDTRDGGTIQREIEGRTIDLVRGITTMRWTFIIDKQGNIAYIDKAVNASEDTGNTLAKIKELIAKG